MYKMCTVTRPNLLADCQLSVVRPRKIGTNHPLQWVVVDVRKTACLSTVVFGFQLYDLVLFNNRRYYIKSRKSSGYFRLASLEGLKEENRSYKKLTLLAHTNAYLINHYIIK